MVSCWDKMIDDIRPGDIVIELGCTVFSNVKLVLMSTLF